MKHIWKLFYWLISALIFSGVTDVFAKLRNTCVTSINTAILVNKLDLSGTSQGAGGVGGHLMVSDGASSQTHHFTCFDGNGNIVALINAGDASVNARYEYGPFGEVICITGPSSGSMAKSNPFRFSTKYADDETDLVYYGNRYYSPSLGRWISRDPAQEGGSINLYGFCSNSPITLFDLLGLLIATTDRNLAGYWHYYYIPANVWKNEEIKDKIKWTKKAVNGVMNADGIWQMGEYYEIPDHFASLAVSPDELKFYQAFVGDPSVTVLEAVEYFLTVLVPGQRQWNEAMYDYWKGDYINGTSHLCYDVAEVCGTLAIGEGLNQAAEPIAALFSQVTDKLYSIAKRMRMPSIRTTTPTAPTQPALVTLVPPKPVSMTMKSLQVDPAQLRLPPTRSEGADPFKLADQIRKYGTSTEGMPPIQVTLGANGEMMINDGVTRATRAAMTPGTTVPVQIIEENPALNLGNLPKVGEHTIGRP